MVWLRSPKPTQSWYRSRLVRGAIVLLINLPLVQGQTAFATRDAVSGVVSGVGRVGAAQTDQAVPVLEPGPPVERELAGGQAHPYQLSLTAGQYVKVVIEQRGLDVLVSLVGPDGQPLTDFDSEMRPQGPETAAWVAEEAGTYRLNVVGKQKGAAGRYGVQVIERRAATEDDRALYQAHRGIAEFARLIRAGKYDDARPVIERALENRRRILGPEHPDVATATNGLANVHRFKGDYVQAEALYQRALEIREKVLGPDHPDVAASLNNLASLYNDRAEYTRAEPLFRRALEIWERSLGKEHMMVGLSLNNLASLYQLRGDYEKAEPIYQRALTIWEKTAGPESPQVAATINNLAEVYYHRGEYAKAEPAYLRALAIKEKTLPPEHPSLAFSLNDLSLLYTQQGEYEKGESFGRRALVILEKTLGPEHQAVATTLNNLGLLYRRKGEYARAEEPYRRSLAIKEKALGPDNFLVAISLNELALLYAAKGELAQAVATLARANAVIERNLTLNLAAGSERQKLAYLATYSRATNLTLSLHSLLAPNDPRALDLAFTTLLRRKGRGLDAMTDTIATLRLHSTPEDRALLDQLAEARSQLAALVLKDPNTANLATYRTRSKPFEEEIERLESDLSLRSAEFRAEVQPVTFSTIQSLLPVGSALVEFAVYTPLDLRTEKSGAPRYLAYVVAAQGAPKWVDLGEAAAIDQAVELWRGALRDPKRKDVRRLARAVDQKVMQPVRTLLGETRRLLIAPDGLLNLIPFAALADEQNRYLVERYTISYLTSGRDLVRLQTSPPSRTPPLVVGNPIFGPVGTIAATADPESRTSSSERPAKARIDSSQVLFPPLPGTEAEVLAIKAVLPEASVLLREQATEAALKQVQAPRILHVATHGFFLNDQEVSPPETRGAPEESVLRMSGTRLSKWAAHIENPLLRSGLALAGANRSKGGDDDGVLTALEVAGLDLWGTKLVVLSACDTGVGDIRNGEGVQGLRRALVLAGSESQVMTLWPVLDESTKDLMVPYYQALQQGQGRSEGLRQVQLRFLRNKDRRHPFYWAAFIQSGEWAKLENDKH